MEGYFIEFHDGTLCVDKKLKVINSRQKSCLRDTKLQNIITTLFPNKK